MKNQIIRKGIISLVAVISLVLGGCDTFENTTPVVVDTSDAGEVTLTVTDIPGITRSGNMVTLVAPENATVYYTLDGSIPTSLSYKYVPGTTKIVIGSEYIGETKLTVKAICIKDGCSSSEVVTSIFTYNSESFTGTSASYTVEFYIQNTDGTYSETATTTAKQSGSTGGVPSYVVYSADGFEEDTKKTTVPATISADGSSVVKVYYARKTINLVLSENNGSGKYARLTGLYGATVPLATAPTYAGYDFEGWKPELPVTFPSDDGNIYAAQWNDATFAFTSTTNNATVNTEAVLGIVATTVSSSDEKVATAVIVGGKIVITSKAKGNGIIICTADAKTATIAVTVAADGTITIDTVTKYVEGNASYKINYYFMDTDGTYPAVPDNTVSRSGVSGSVPVYDEKMQIGFEKDTVKTTVPAIIAADNSSIVSVYYKRIMVTVTLIANEGVLAGSGAVSGYYGAAVTIPANPTREGFSFIAWKPAVPSTFITDITCVAQWSATFTPTTDSSIANTEAVLGVVATTVTSSDTKIATVEISNAKIAVTSVATGTATITCTDASTHTATISVTVATDGSVSITKITKYSTSAQKYIRIDLFSGSVDCGNFGGTDSQTVRVDKFKFEYMKSGWKVGITTKASTSVSQDYYQLQLNFPNAGGTWEPFSSAATDTYTNGTYNTTYNVIDLTDAAQTLLWEPSDSEIADMVAGTKQNNMNTSIAIKGSGVIITKVFIYGPAPDTLPTEKTLFSGSADQGHWDTSGAGQKFVAKSMYNWKAGGKMSIITTASTVYTTEDGQLVIGDTESWNPLSQSSTESELNAMISSNNAHQNTSVKGTCYMLNDPAQTTVWTPASTLQTTMMETGFTIKGCAFTLTKVTIEITQPTLYDSLEAALSAE